VPQGRGVLGGKKTILYASSQYEPVTNAGTLWHDTFVVPEIRRLGYTCRNIHDPLDHKPLFHTFLPEADLVLGCGHGGETVYTGGLQEYLLECGKYDPKAVKDTGFKLLSCVPPETRIRTSEENEIPIREVLEDGRDSVLQGYNIETGVKEKSEILGTLTRGEEELIEIELIDGKSLKVTHDHPCIVRRDGEVQVIKAKDLQETDLLPVPEDVKSYVLGVVQGDGWRSEREASICQAVKEFVDQIEEMMPINTWRWVEERERTNVKNSPLKCSLWAFHLGFYQTNPMISFHGLEVFLTLREV